jgi:hypothetical protein
MTIIIINFNVKMRVSSLILAALLGTMTFEEVQAV